MKESKPDLLVVIVGMSVTDSLCNGYHSNYQHHSNQFIYQRVGIILEQWRTTHAQTWDGHFQAFAALQWVLELKLHTSIINSYSLVAVTIL